LTLIVAERRRPSVRSPSTLYGTIASSTVTEAIVRSSRCGFVTLMLIWPGCNSTRRMSNSSAGGGLRPRRSTIDPPVVVNSETAATRASSGTKAHRRQPAPRSFAEIAPASIYSRTSKKPIQPSSANSLW
jgi:hypothetical protein